jgi:membrane protein
VTRNASRLPRSLDELARRLQPLQQFLLYVGERFVRDNCTRHASTLAYTTLLSIVPLMTVAFSVLAAFPVFEPITDRVRLLIFSNLVPTSGELVETYVERFSSKAAGLTAAGIIALLVTALLMMSAVDKALNEIWHVQQRRRPVQGFLIYWTLLTLGPLLIGASLVMTSYVESLQAFAAIERTLPRQLVFNVMSLISEFLAFLFLYAAVPNRRVPLKHAALGALVAALLFELAKRAFAWYVTSFPTYEAVYGALAALPIFLIWLYLSWTIVLLGGVFTQALSGFRAGRAGPLSDPRLRLILAVRLVGHLWYAQRHGRAVNRKGLTRREQQAGDEAILECLNILERAKIAVRTERGDWALARDLTDYTLLDLYRSQPFVLPEPTPTLGDRDEWDQRLAAALREAGDGVRGALDLPLERLFRGARPQGDRFSP